MVVLNQIGWIVAPLTFLIMMGSLTTCTLWMALHFEHFLKFMMDGYNMWPSPWLIVLAWLTSRVWILMW